jgi:hypothetical protein
MKNNAAAEHLQEYGRGTAFSLGEEMSLQNTSLATRHQGWPSNYPTR